MKINLVRTGFALDATKGNYGELTVDSIVLLFVCDYWAPGALPMSLE